MKNLKFILLTSLLLFNTFAFALAAPLADSGDELTINLPRASSTLSGISQISFRLVDDENPTPPYEVALFQTNCINKVGTIVANNHSIKSTNSIYSVTWNTDGPILDLASIPNGNYCFKVCVTFSNNGQSDYAVCDARPITLADQVNRAPQITSTSPNNTYLVGQTYGYNVTATDPDGDPITFSLQNAPGFLLINNQTGAISTNGTLDQPGVYSFLVVVTDSRGAKATQSITITVVEAPTKELTSIKVLEPNKDSIFSGTNNIIRWEIKNISEVKDIGLFYSSDGAKWISIAKPTINTKEYIWDVSGISTDNYFVKAVVQDEAGSYFESISEEFSIVSSEDGQKESAVGLKSLSPEPDSIIREIKEISAIIIPSQGASISIENIILKLNNQDISDTCRLEDNKLICDVSNTEINEGKHKLYLEVTDSKDQKADQTWHFTLDKSTGNSQKEGESSLSTALILGIICCLALLLILIPWLLYTLWKRRNDDDYNQEDYYLEDTSTELDPTTDITTNYYQTPVTTETTPVADDELTFDENDYVIQETELADTTQPQNVVEPVATPDTVSQTVEVNQVPAETTTQEETKTDSDDLDELTEDDIPDWLKTDDDTASAPVSVAGDDIEDIQAKKQTQADMSGAEPYDDYGLASKDG